MVERKKQEQGFTLIELMLATSLLMMVLFSGYYAYSLYTQKWQKRVDIFWQGTQEEIANDTINKLLTSANPYVVKNTEGKAAIYFKASSEEIEWITGSAIFSGQTALVNLSVIQNGNYKSLLYKEKSMANFVLINEEQLTSDDTEFWEHNVVLLKDIESVTFNYYGWSSFSDAIRFVNEEIESDGARNTPTQVWYDNHQTKTHRILPEQVQLVIQQLDKTYEFKVELPKATIYQLMSHIRKDID